MAKQEWVCEGCGLHGTAEYDSERADVLTVLRAIRDHHETLASKYAPLCHFDVDRVRVRNDALMTGCTGSVLISIWLPLRSLRNPSRPSRSKAVAPEFRTLPGVRME